MGWRKQWLREQEQLAKSKDTARLVDDAIELWGSLPQLKYVLSSQSWRRFRLMQIAIHRELRRRHIYPRYVRVERGSLAILSNLR